MQAGIGTNLLVAAADVTVRSFARPVNYSSVEDGRGDRN